MHQPGSGGVSRRRQVQEDTSSFKNLRTSIANRISASLPSNSSFVQQMTQFIASPDTLGAPAPTVVRMPEIQMPKWESDDAVTNCNLCRNIFTFSRRKHHCRLCGKIFCQNCSNNQVRISRFYNYPQRICNGCFETIRDRSLQQRQEQFRFTEEYAEVPCNFNRIPDAVIIRILRFVPERNLLLDVALVSRHFHYLTNSNDLWKALFFNHWAPQLVRSEVDDGDGSYEEGLILDLGRASAGDVDVYERYLKGSRREGSPPGAIIRTPSLDEDEDGAHARTRVVYLDDDDFDEGHWKKLFQSNIELDRRQLSTINYLPVSAVTHILRYLSATGVGEVLVARQVCRLWRDIVDSECLFSHACRSRFACAWQPEGGRSSLEWGRHAAAAAAAAKWYGTGDFSALLPGKAIGASATVQTTAVHSEIRKIAVAGASPARLSVMLQHSATAAANAVDSANSTALHLAVRMQVPAAVGLLLAAGADVNARGGGTGRTALHIALDTARGKKDPIVQLLLDAGADLSLQDYGLGETPLHKAVLGAPLLLPALLAGEGAADALQVRSREGLCPPLFACSVGAESALSAMLEHDPDQVLAAATADGRNSLMLAASHGTLAMVRALLDANGHEGGLAAVRWRGKTAADCAREHGKEANARLLETAVGSGCAVM